VRNTRWRLGLARSNPPINSRWCPRSCVLCNGRAHVERQNPKQKMRPLTLPHIAKTQGAERPADRRSRIQLSFPAFFRSAVGRNASISSSPKVNSPFLRMNQLFHMLLAKCSAQICIRSSTHASMYPIPIAAAPGALMKRGSALLTEEAVSESTAVLWRRSGAGFLYRLDQNWPARARTPS
jgi:hypothetical protein